ncbi:unnamed protein product, partial [Meganyctiphanes norvegica]
GLEPGTEYILEVVAVNSQGISEPTNLTFHTPIDVAEKQTSAVAITSSRILAWSPILGALLGLMLTFIMCIAGVVVFVRIRRRRDNDVAALQKAKVIYKKSSSPGHHTIADDGGFTQDTGPDIIQIKSDSAEETIFSDYQRNQQKQFPLCSSALLSSMEQEILPGASGGPSCFSTEFGSHGEHSELSPTLSAHTSPLLSLRRGSRGSSLYADDPVQLRCSDPLLQMKPPGTVAVTQSSKNCGVIMGPIPPLAE